MLFRAPVYNNFSNLSRLPDLFGILLSTSISKLVGCQVDQEISYFVSITEGHKKKIVLLNALISIWNVLVFHL